MNLYTLRANDFYNIRLIVISVHDSPIDNYAGVVVVSIIVRDNIIYNMHVDKYCITSQLLDNLIILFLNFLN